MEKKHLIITVACILCFAVVLGLVLNRRAGGAADLPGQTTENTGHLQGTEAFPGETGGTTAPSDTTPGTGPATEPSGSSPTGPSAGADTQPSSAPTAPSTAPTDTVTVPTQPTAGPTETPTTTPTDPITQPTEPTSEPTQPPVTQPTVPNTEPTQPPVIQPTEPATEPTGPAHTHTYQSTSVTEPTLSSGGYTTYTCSSCGHSYNGDPTAALTMQDILNDQPLNPSTTGVQKLDDLVQSVLAQITNSGDTTYDKLQAIQNYQLTVLSHGSVQVDAAKALDFAGDKVFKNAGEMVIAYEAYQALSGGKGVADHYAAVFAVLTRAIGLESYVVTGRADGVGHVWNVVNIDGSLYAFDAYDPEASVFAGDAAKLPGYAYTDLEGDLSAQSGFAAADTFAVTLTITDDSGETTQEYIWDISQASSSGNDILCQTVKLTAAGTVKFTLTVTQGSGEFRFTDANSKVTVGTTISGTLEPTSGAYNLRVEERNSMMNFKFRIDN